MAKLYLPLDVMFFDDEKIAAVGERPAWLYLAMCCKAKQLGTGGYLTEQQVVKLAVPGWKARVKPLLTERLVVLTGGRYFIPAWTKWNETPAQVAQRQRRDRERNGRAGDKMSPQAETSSRGNVSTPPPTAERTPSARYSRVDDAPTPIYSPVTEHLNCSEGHGDGDDLESTGRIGAGQRHAADTFPPGTRDISLLSEVKRSEVPDVTHQSLDVASVDARERGDEPGHSPAGSITALYAAGVPLSDHGRAHRVIAEALAHYPAEAVRSGVLRLVAERRTCTLDTLRIAIHSNDAPAAGATPPHRRTATEKASQWLTVGLDDDPPQLRAIPGGLT